MPARPTTGVFLLATSVTAAAIAASISGCGYAVGNGFAADVRTVHVPMFTSDTFRRNQAEQLTEAVHKQISLRTPYRLVTGDTPADARLTGHIVEVRKDLLTEDRFDDARELQVFTGIRLRFEDLRTGRIIASRTVPLTGETALVADATFAPEIGQSLATAQQAVFDDLAREVVNVMEVPW